MDLIGAFRQTLPNYDLPSALVCNFVFTTNWRKLPSVSTP